MKTILIICAALFTPSFAFASLQSMHCVLRVNAQNLHPATIDMDPTFYYSTGNEISQTVTVSFETPDAPAQHTFLLIAQYWRDDATAEDPNLFFMRLFEMDGGEMPIVLGKFQGDPTQPISNIMSATTSYGVPVIANCVSHW